MDSLQLKIFHKQKKRQKCICRKYLNKLYQETQGAYKVQGVSMMSGDVDATLLSDLFNYEEGTVCFSFYLIADRPFYKLCQSEVFPKVWNGSTIKCYH